jgi:hypothetical protein
MPNAFPHPSRRRITYQFDVLAFVQGEGSLPISQSPQALATRTGMVAVINDDADFLYLNFFFSSHNGQ